MELTESNYGLLYSKLKPLSTMPGYPTDETQIEMLHTAILRFVQGKPLYQLPPRKPMEDEDYSHPEGTIPFIGPIPKGIVTDLDLLVRAIYETKDRFPTPVRIRQLYGTLGFSCDNKEEFDKLELCDEE